MRTKTQKEVRSTGLTFSNNGQRQGENEQLESYEVLELNEALDNFAVYVIKIDYFIESALYGFLFTVRKTLETNE